MHFEDFSSFLDMAGYGLYVWLSFGCAAISLLVLWLDSFFSKRAMLKQVLTEQKRQARIKAAAEQSATAEKSATAQKSATAEQRTNGETI
ncbi:heme exporter protein CcmD [Paraglaciecola arctica]|uniref:Heme exporter protein D n=1 Tax=Paraglaciecola arctica BSs20135 TaxID=493475 RepID=K6XBW1_9ALTE|nr:heme exporter protein CcmD [Paraglaciecola arctica]GAC18124.1 heme exporter protein D [Paraglaciecola arctica BSs20135]